MKLPLFIGAIALTWLSTPTFAGVGVGVGVSTTVHSERVSDEGIPIWEGPGYYNGIYFANEFDFLYWRRSHYTTETYYETEPSFYFGVYGDDGYYWRDGRHHHGHRGWHGGGHHGGHHGGGHHGGGHRGGGGHHGGGHHGGGHHR